METTASLGATVYLREKTAPLELLDPLIPLPRNCSPSSWAIRPTWRPLMSTSASPSATPQRPERAGRSSRPRDLTQDRRRAIVRIEPQAGAQRGKNPGGKPGIGRWVPRSRWSRRGPHGPRCFVNRQARAHCGTRLMIAEALELLAEDLLDGSLDEAWPMSTASDSIESKSRSSPGPLSP